MKPKKTFYLLETDLVYLSQLLESGYALREALPYVSKFADQIMLRLQMGDDIQQILVEGCKGRFQSHLAFFIQILSLQNAIESAHAMMHFEHSLQKKLFQKATYPMFILCFSYIMMIFFTRYILPTMMEGLPDQDQTMFIMMHLLQLVCQGLGLWMIAGVLFAIILWKNTKWRIKVGVCVCKYIRVLCDYESYLFAGYMVRLSSQGISTKVALHYLLNAKKNTLFYYLISQLEQGLQQGEDLNMLLETSSLLTSDLQKSFRIGVLTSSLTETLQTFIIQQEHVWDRKMRLYAYCIQCIAYVFVGILVLLVYQVMLMPLSMLQTM